MKFELPPLPYGYDALEPFIDEATMKLHHDKHHATYVSKLNEAIALHPELSDTPLETLLKDLSVIPEDIRAVVRNHGGGHFNHSLFWEIMAAPGANAGPEGAFLAALENDFASVSAFKEAFSKAAAGVFGSGWAWLAADATGKLSIISTANQDCPLSLGLTPVLGLDVWEHAYYLKFQNKRSDYIESWWNVVSWQSAAKRFEALK